MEVLLDFRDEPMQLRMQLDIHYHADRIIRDQLLAPTDIPSVKVMLRNRIPRTFEQVMNRIANNMLEQNGTAETTSVNLSTICDIARPKGREESIYYTFGHNYKGGGRRHIRQPWKGRNRRPPTTLESRLNTDWICGVKGCLVCGKDHFTPRTSPSRTAIGSQDPDGEDR